MMKHLSRTAYWETEKAFQDYTRPPELMGGEKLAFAEVLGNDLTGKTVLDLGCGGGRTSGFLRDMGGEVTGLDISRRLIEAARQTYPDIRFQVGDAANLPYPDSGFDCVLFSFNGLDLLYPEEMRTRCIGEVRRVMRPGGIFIVSSHNLSAMVFGWHKFMRPRKLLFRAKHIIQGNIFRKGCYVVEPDDFNMSIYYTKPDAFRSNTEASRFKCLGIFPNDPVLVWAQQTMRTNILTRICDPWPYYAFQKLPVN